MLCFARAPGLEGMKFVVFVESMAVLSLPEDYFYLTDILVAFARVGEEVLALMWARLFSSSEYV